MRRFGIPTFRSLAWRVSVALMAPDEKRNDISVWARLVSRYTHTASGAYRLPEGKENDELDRKDFQKRRIPVNVFLDLDIELDQAVHRNGDAHTLYDQYLPLLAHKQRRRRAQHTQICAKAGFSDSSQYTLLACAMTAMIVVRTRKRQYWKTLAQTT